jgi:putative transposase
MTEITGRHRIRRSHAEWRQLIEEQAGSGLTQSGFCALRGISVGSFRNWKHRLAAEAPPDPWVELGAFAGHGAAGWDIELDLGEGVRLRFRRC